MNKKITTSLIRSFFLATVNLQANEKHQLSTITVTSATKVEQSLKNVTSNISVITNKEIEEKKFTTIIDALNSVTGISFTSNGGIGSTTSLNLRGSDNRRVLVLIDGIRYTDQSDLSGTDLSHIMMSNVERIEIIKGAQSGIWGADASAGVINIITKDVNKGFSIGANAEYGSFNTKKFGTNLSYANNYFDVIILANQLKTNSFTSSAPKGEDIKQYEDDSYLNTTMNLKTNVYFNKYSKLGFNITDIDATKDYDSFANPNDPIPKNDTQSRLYNLSYNITLKNHDINIKYSSAEIKRDQIGTTFGVKSTSGENEAIELSDIISYNQKDFLVFGIGTTKDKINYTQVSGLDGNGENKSKNIYLTNSNVFDSLIFTQSLRYDSFDNFNNKTTGKVGAKYFLTPDLSVATNYGTSYSVPLLIQNLNPWANSNFNIKPEESRSYDISVQYKGLNVAYFHQKIEDLIEWFDPTPGGIYGDETYRNLDGKSTLKGFEIEYKENIFEDIYLSLGYINLSAKDKDNKFLARRTKDNLKFGIDYYGISKLHLSLFGEYVGSRFEALDENGTQTGRYTVWNSTINYEINKNLNAYVKIDNITDKYYQSVDGFATAPRSAYIGLKATF